MRVLCFARVRELLGRSEFTLRIVRGATLHDLWDDLIALHAAIAPLRSSTRLSRNGRLASLEEVLEPHDEVALLPPVGGG